MVDTDIVKCDVRVRCWRWPGAGPRKQCDPSLANTRLISHLVMITLIIFSTPQLSGGRRVSLLSEIANCHQVSDAGLTVITTMFLSKKVRLFIDHWDKIWQLQFSKQTDCWCCSRSADELHYILLRSTEIATRLGTEFIDCFKWVSWKPEINVNHASSIDKYDPHLRQQALALKSAVNLKRVDNLAFWSVLHFIKKHPICI